MSHRGQERWGVSHFRQAGKSDASHGRQAGAGLEQACGARRPGRKSDAAQSRRLCRRSGRGALGVTTQPLQLLPVAKPPPPPHPLTHRHTHSHPPRIHPPTHPPHPPWPLQDDAVAFELNLAVKGDVTLALWFADHVSEVGTGAGAAA